MRTKVDIENSHIRVFGVELESKEQSDRISEHLKDHYGKNFLVTFETDKLKKEHTESYQLSQAVQVLKRISDQFMIIHQGGKGEDNIAAKGIFVRMVEALEMIAEDTSKEPAKWHPGLEYLPNELVMFNDSIYQALVINDNCNPENSDLGIWSRIK